MKSQWFCLFHVAGAGGNHCQSGEILLKTFSFKKDVEPVQVKKRIHKLRAFLHNISMEVFLASYHVTVIDVIFCLMR